MYIETPAGARWRGCNTVSHRKERKKRHTEHRRSDASARESREKRVVRPYPDDLQLVEHFPVVVFKLGLQLII